MGPKVVGVVETVTSPKETLQNIVRLDELGVSAVWLVSSGQGGDATALLAAAAERTEHILLGTSIVPIWSRHPVTLAREAQVVAGLARGRFRLGVGPGGPMVETTFGSKYYAPLSHLKEYVRVLKALLQGGNVDFDGDYYRASATIPEPVEVPVMVSALRRRSFELSGAEADGAIPWVCPHRYLEKVALAAMGAAAAAAGRARPPLIVHAPVCVHEDREEVRAALRQRLGRYPTWEYYARMFADAGFPRSEETGWTDAMIDSLTISGDEQEVARRIEETFEWGASGLLVTVLAAGGDPTQSTERTLSLLADIG